MDILLPLAIFCTFGAVVLAGLLRMAKEEERRWLALTLGLAFAVRLVAATVFALVPEARIFHDDADGYELNGMAIAAGWAGRGPPLPVGSGQNHGFTVVAATLYYLLGGFRVILAYFNAVLGTITILLVYVLARQLVHKLVARRAALLTAFMPSMILWSAVALKDTLMTGLIVLCLLSCLRLKERLSFWSLLGTVLPLAAIQPIRFYIVYFVALAVAASLVLDRGMNMVRGFYKQLALMGVVVALFTAIGLARPAQEGTDVLSFERVSSYRSGMARTAESGFRADADISTPTRALLFLPVGLTVLLLGPFPWQITSLRAAMAMPETILWWLMFPSMIRGIAFLLRYRFSPSSPLVIFSVTLSLAYSLVHGNVGSGFRQRAQIFVFLFIFAALGRYQKRCRQANLNDQLLLTPHPE